MTIVELVRHAEAMRRDGWWGRPDRARPLTDAGWRQSWALVRELTASGPVDWLYSSPFTRCVQTLQPLAEALGTPVRADEAIAEATTLPVLDHGDAWVASAWLGGRALAFVDRVVSEHAGGRLVACSHGDVIPALMALLCGRDRLDLSDVRLRKGARFTLTFDRARCVGVVASPPT